MGNPGTGWFSRFFQFDRLSALHQEGKDQQASTAEREADQISHFGTPLLIYTNQNHALFRPIDEVLLHPAAHIVSTYGSIR